MKLKIPQQNLITSIKCRKYNVSLRMLKANPMPNFGCRPTPTMHLADLTRFVGSQMMHHSLKPCFMAQSSERKSITFTRPHSVHLSGKRRPQSQLKISDYDIRGALSKIPNITMSTRHPLLHLKWDCSSSDCPIKKLKYLPSCVMCHHMLVVEG